MKTSGRNRISVQLINLTTLAVVLSGAAHRIEADNTTPLFLEPDLASEILTTIIPSSEQMLMAEAVIDEEKQSKGWFFMNYTVNLRGFVELRHITKELTIKPGAPIHLRPSRDSPVITDNEEGDEIELIWAGEWGEVRFKKTLTVFFIKPFENLPVIEFESEPEPSEYEVVSPPSKEPVSDPLEIEPVVPPLEPDAVTQLPSGANLPRYFEGTFVKTSKVPGGVTPKYRFQLFDNNETHIALIDVSELLITNPVEIYVGRKVIIYGRAEKLPNSKKIVVTARTLRPR